MERISNRLEIRGGDLDRQRPPSVPIAEQHDEVGSRRHLLAPRDLAQADLHRALVEGRLLTDAPAQVDRLEATAMRRTQISQCGEDLVMEDRSLGAEIAKRGADEEPEGPRALWHLPTTRVAPAYHEVTSERPTNSPPWRTRDRGVGSLGHERPPVCGR